LPCFTINPPLDDRSERLLGPGAKRLLRERMERAEAAALSAREAGRERARESALCAERRGDRPPPGPRARGNRPLDGSKSIGNPSSAHLRSCARDARRDSPEIRVAVGSEKARKAALFALLLGRPLAQPQLALIREHPARGPRKAARFADTLKPLGARARLPVSTGDSDAERLSAPDATACFERIKAVIGPTARSRSANSCCSRWQEPDPEGGKAAATAQTRSIVAVAGEAAVLLSLLAHAARWDGRVRQGKWAAPRLRGRGAGAPSELNIERWKRPPTG